MPHVDTPWVGLAALVAMFVLPFLPSWLFEGPRTIRHRPRRHKGRCGPVLLFTPDEWQAFLAGVQGGEFELPA